MDFNKNYRRIFPEALRQPVYLCRRRLLRVYQDQLSYLFDKDSRRMASRLRSLKDTYAGQRCIIMGNGPSLNKMDLELFRDEFVWGSNRCYLLFDRISWRPAFYTAVDTRVVPDNADEINRLAKDLPETSFFFPDHFSKTNVIILNSNVYFYLEKPQDETRLPDGLFTRDASRFVYTVRSVTIAAMQLAVYFGFNPIYLIGCDTSYSTPASTEYENETRTQLISTQDDDPNHFDPRYFGKGKKWHIPRTDLMIFHYEQAYQVCKQMGVEIYNATVGGKLEVFPRTDYRDLLNR